MENKKIKLECVSKNELRSTFVFKKSWEMVDAIDSALDKLVSFRFDSSLKDSMRYDNFNPDVNIEKWCDEVFNMKNDDYSVEGFFGKKEIILIINSRVDGQKEISEAVFEFGDFGGEDGD